MKCAYHTKCISREQPPNFTFPFLQPSQYILYTRRYGTHCHHRSLTESSVPCRLVSSPAASALLSILISRLLLFVVLYSPVLTLANYLALSSPLPALISRHRRIFHSLSATAFLAFSFSYRCSARPALLSVCSGSCRRTFSKPVSLLAGHCCTSSLAYLPAAMGWDEIPMPSSTVPGFSRVSVQPHQPPFCFRTISSSLI